MHSILNAVHGYLILKVRGAKRLLVQRLTSDPKLVMHLQLSNDVPLVILLLHILPQNCSLSCLLICVLVINFISAQLDSFILCSCIVAFYLGWHPPKNQHIPDLIYIVAFLSVDVKSAVCVP